jgi:hypothetical protein
VVFSLIRQLYNNFKSVHKTIRIGCYNIFLSIVLTTALTLNLYVIIYSFVGQIARQLIQCGRLGQFRLASRLLYNSVTKTT